MKKASAFVFVLSALIAMTGCGNAQQPMEKPTNESAHVEIPQTNSESFKIAKEDSLQKTTSGQLDLQEQQKEAMQQEKDEKQKEEQKNIQQEEIKQEKLEQKETKQAIKTEEKELDLADNSTPPESVETPPMPKENSAVVGYNDRKSWWFKRNADHLPPSAQQEININQYGAHYLGDVQEKNIYLTFDEGYENGYTPQILDILKENDVKAAFFVTKPYIKTCPDLVKRMVEEGHIVGNHSDTHPDVTTISDEQIAQELKSCADYFKEVTGTEMPHYFRPPEGVYSIRTLEKTQQAGYQTIFWSFAYKDWDPESQPGKQAAYEMVMNNYHNGSVMLLHAVSESNTQALDSMIKSLKEKGFVFRTLDELP